MSREPPATFHIAEKLAALSPEERIRLNRRFGRRVTAADLIANCLRQLGITHVYGISGTPIDQVILACAEQGMRPIGVHHQQAAVLMATAQNYASGRMAAVTLVSAGPAVTNAATGILVAYDNCWPVVVIGGRRSLNQQGIGYFQELNAVPILETITKWSATIPATDQIGSYLQKACEVAVSGRPGPVYLDLPEDVLTGTVASSYPTCVARMPSRPTPNREQIQHVVQTLKTAHRPALIIGKGVRWTVPPESLAQFVERFRLPFITSPMGRGFLSDEHPLCCNSVRSLLQAKADALLVLGARLNWVFRYGSEFSAGATIIQVDVERDSCGVASDKRTFIQSDAGEFVAAMLDHGDGAEYSSTDASRQDDVAHWIQVFQKEKPLSRQRLESMMDDDSIPMSPYRAMKEVRDAIPADTICATEGSVIMSAAQQVLNCYRPASRFDAGTNGCMGTAIPFAIGAKMAAPHRPVLAVCGDFGFGQSAMELETCVRHKVPIVCIVSNNDGNSGALKQMAYGNNYPERVTMFQPDIQYQRIMETFGGVGTRVTEPEKLGPTLREAIASAQPYCINVVVDPHAPLQTGWWNRSRRL